MANQGPSTGIAAVVAAMVYLLSARVWGASQPVPMYLGAILSVSLGFVAGFCWFGVRPHWPPREAQDRLLLILLPAVITVELGAAFVSSSQFLIRKPHLQLLTWLPQLALAAIAGRLLLHDSIYLKDIS